MKPKFDGGACMMIKDLNPDKPIEDKWRELEDVPFDDEYLSENWWLFKKGTHREDIWHYFDEHHSKGVHYLLYEMNK